MLCSIRLFSPAAFLIALAVFASHSVRADDAATSEPSAATSQPAAATGSIAVTVLDSDSQPVPKARLNLYPPKKVSADGDDTPPVKPKAIAKGRTDDDGKFTFENVAAAEGKYRVSASLKSAGTKGSAKVSVSSDNLNPEITITLTAPDADSGGATTAPSTMPAQ